MKISAAPVLLAASAVAAKAPTATISNNVTYVGNYQDQVESFLGVRYALDTGGARRFKPPVLYRPARGSVIQATDDGPICPQGQDSGDTTPISEDCLLLNIQRPNGTTAGSNLPVNVYIHGGSFIAGSKNDLRTQPGGLILESVANGHPILHVNINYRLGVFGFAQSDALEKEGSENAGVRDQRLAIEFVKKNIRGFGGDPNNISIRGQSSGGLAIGMQILAFGASKEQVFQRAMPESQALEGGITGNFTLIAMQNVADASGCNTTDLQSAATVKCLRGLSTEELLNAQTSTAGDGPAQNVGDQWLPVVDGDFLPAAPSELIATGRFYNVTMMAGWCQGDANPFVGSPKTPQDTRAFLRAYLPGFSQANLNKLLALYPTSEFPATHFPNGTLEQPSQLYRLGRIVRDIVFVCQDVYLGQALLKNGNEVYFWIQNQTLLTPELEAEGEYGFGVIHTSEFEYTFANFSHVNVSGLPFHPTTSDYALKKHESRSWSSFMSLGRPTLPGKATLKGFNTANFDDENLGVYVVGGPSEGYSGPGGNAKTRGLVATQKLRDRCAFLNQPEVIQQQGY